MWRCACRARPLTEGTEGIVIRTPITLANLSLSAQSGVAVADEAQSWLGSHHLAPRSGQEQRISVTVYSTSGDKPLLQATDLRYRQPVPISS